MHTTLNVLLQTSRGPSAFSESHLPGFFLATKQLRRSFGVGPLDALKALWSLGILQAVLRVGRCKTKSQRNGEQNAVREILRSSNV